MSTYAIQYNRTETIKKGDATVGMCWSSGPIVFGPDSIEFEEFTEQLDQDGSTWTAVRIYFKSGRTRLTNRGVVLKTVPKGD